MTRRSLKEYAPWLVFVLFLLAPLYAVSISVSIRTGVFDLKDKTISDKEIQAIWTLVASGLATSATIVGLLLSRSHNQRMLERTALDTVVKGLELVGDEGKYAPRARVAGALAALVHLGHPVIAMRTLSAAWKDDAVDAATGCWLISEVLKTGSAESQVEASGLLRNSVSKLSSDSKKATFEWPDALWDQWPTELPLDARFNNLSAAMELVASRDRAWWGDSGLGWALVLLDEARLRDPTPGMRTLASLGLKCILETYESRQAGWRFKGGWKVLSTLKSEMLNYEPPEDSVHKESEIVKGLDAWSRQGSL